MAEATTPSAFPPAPGHRWRFFRAGGFDQALLDTGADLGSLESLDQKLWAALSCPVDGIEFDRRTLELIDADGDRHIRVPEVLAAVRWARTALKDPDVLVRRPDRISLSAIDEATEEGRGVLAGARLVLATLGKAGAEEVALEDVIDSERILAQARFNGDGVVPPSSIEDAALRSVVEDIVEQFGGESDRSGARGATAELVDRFYFEAGALAAWRGGGRNAEILPFGADTAARYELFRAVRPKIDDYFRRCRLAAYDSRAAELLGPTDEDYRKLATVELGGTAEAVAPFPLAVPGAAKPLPLGDGVNPAWADAVRRFARDVAAPVLGKGALLTEEGWEVIAGRFAAHEAWLESKPATTLEKLPPERLAAVVDANDREALLALVASDKAAEPVVAAVASVEKLLRYCRDLHLFVNNFVAFRDFYTRAGKASFQAGTLYVDGRSCDLCLPVADVNRHAAAAAPSQIYLAYCDCVRRQGGEKMSIVAAVTAGDSDYLMAGRNGIFYDRTGRDWDATVVRVVDQPIGMRQAFWAPYKRLARMLGEQFQKLAASRARAAEEKQAAAAIAAGKPAGPGGTAAPFDVAKFAGIFAAIGLAVGAIGTAVAALVTGLFRLAWWQAPLAIAGLILAVSGPAVILAWFKLRARNLGPLLDANGWAVNARARINIPFGASLTAVARLPENAERALADPFAEKRSPWRLYLALAVLAGILLFLWREGHLARLMGP